MAAAMPANAIAADRDCNVIAALASGSKNQARNIGIAVNRRDQLDITYNGKRSLFQGAEYCEIDVTSASFDLDCTWEFEKDEARARGLFSAYRIRAAKCLPVPFERLENRSSDNTTELTGYNAVVEHPDGTQSEIRLRLREYKSSASTLFTMFIDLTRE